MPAGSPAPISDPIIKRGWNAREVRKDRVSYDLGPPQLAAIDALMARIRAGGTALGNITKADFSHPDLDPLLAAMFRDLRTGLGIVVLRGFPADKYDAEGIQAIYWGIGTHLGRGCSQSAYGDLIGHVTDRGTGRGYQGTRKLSLHTDAPEFVALLCINRAMRGGENVFASALRVKEVVECEHPEYIEILERGFPWHRRGEEAPGAEPVTPYNVPIYSTVDGVTSCRYARETIDAALAALGREMTPLERDALAFFESVPLRNDLRCDLQLERGEAVFLNNFEVMHARNAFEDWPDPRRKRLLYRLWIQGQPTRPLKREVLVFQNKGGRHGIDPQPGRIVGKGAAYDVIKSAANH